MLLPSVGAGHCADARARRYGAPTSRWATERLRNRFDVGSREKARGKYFEPPLDVLAHAAHLREWRSRGAADAPVRGARVLGNAHATDTPAHRDYNICAGGENAVSIRMVKSQRSRLERLAPSQATGLWSLLGGWTATVADAAFCSLTPRVALGLASSNSVSDSIARLCVAPDLI